MAKKIAQKILKYTAIFEPAEEGGFVVSVPALPGCMTQGETLEEAKKNLIQAMQCHAESFRREGHRPPEATEEFVGTVEIPL